MPAHLLITLVPAILMFIWASAGAAWRWSAAAMTAVVAIAGLALFTDQLDGQLGRPTDQQIEGVSTTLASANAQLIAFVLTGALLSVQLFNRFGSRISLRGVNATIMTYALAYIAVGTLVPLWAAWNPREVVHRAGLISGVCALLSIVPFVHYLAIQMTPLNLASSYIAKGRSVVTRWRLRRWVRDYVGNIERVLPPKLKFRTEAVLKGRSVTALSIVQYVKLALSIYSTVALLHDLEPGSRDWHAVLDDLTSLLVDVKRIPDIRVEDLLESLPSRIARQARATDLDVLRAVLRSLTNLAKTSQGSGERKDQSLQVAIRDEIVRMFDGDPAPGATHRDAIGSHWFQVTATYFTDVTREAPGGRLPLRIEVDTNDQVSNLGRHDPQVSRYYDEAILNFVKVCPVLGSHQEHALTPANLRAVMENSDVLARIPAWIANEKKIPPTMAAERAIRTWVAQLVRPSSIDLTGNLSGDVEADFLPLEIDDLRVGAIKQCLESLRKCIEAYLYSGQDRRAAIVASFYFELLCVAVERGDRVVLRMTEEYWFSCRHEIVSRFGDSEAGLLRRADFVSGLSKLVDRPLGGLYSSANVKLAKKASEEILSLNEEISEGMHSADQGLWQQASLTLNEVWEIRAPSLEERLRAIQAFYGGWDYKPESTAEQLMSSIGNAIDTSPRCKILALSIVWGHESQFLEKGGSSRLLRKAIGTMEDNLVIGMRVNPSEVAERVGWQEAAWSEYYLAHESWTQSDLDVDPPGKKFSEQVPKVFTTVNRNLLSLLQELHADLHSSALGLQHGNWRDYRLAPSERQYAGFDLPSHVVVREIDGSWRLLRDSELRATECFTWGYSGTGPHNLAQQLMLDALGNLAFCQACMGVVVGPFGGLRNCDSCRGSGWNSDVRDLWRLYVEEYVQHWRSGDESAICWSTSRLEIVSWAISAIEEGRESSVRRRTN